MISIEKYPPKNGQNPAVAVRFNYIEPTHEIVKLLRDHGHADAFRSVHGHSDIPELAWKQLDEDRIDEILGLKAEVILDTFGRQIVADQEQRAEAKQAASEAKKPVE
jgi:hypothetical protein